MKELWQYRELFYFFSWRDLKVKYKQTTLGLAWAILQPVAMMSIFVLFFANALQLSTQALPPAVFYLGALLYWNLFQAGLSHSAESMITNANIIKKIYFPRLIIPISSILVALFDFLVAAVVFVAILIYHDLLGQLPQLNYLNALLAMCSALLITLITTFGFGIYLAALTVKYRDFRYIIPFSYNFFSLPRQLSIR
ncbi:MAG: ABC transporter permease [Saprospiraceae bacterium]|nr:ABC transporter permease [Saprospiraceae bacterium]